MNAKWTLRIAVLSLAVSAMFSTRAEVGPALGDMVRNPDGSIWRAGQHAASNYCQEHGSRLPTVRELAMYSQSLGARKIRETAYPGVWTGDWRVQAEVEHMRSEGYHPTYVKIGLDRGAVDFYFDRLDERPSGDHLGNYWLWSSSVFPWASDNEAYVLLANGSIALANRSLDYRGSAVRCVR